MEFCDGPYPLCLEGAGGNAFEACANYASGEYHAYYVVGGNDYFCCEEDPDGIPNCLSAAQAAVNKYCPPPE